MANFGHKSTLNQCYGKQTYLMDYLYDANKSQVLTVNELHFSYK